MSYVLFLDLCESDILRRWDTFLSLSWCSSQYLLLLSSGEAAACPCDPLPEVATVRRDLELQNYLPVREKSRTSEILPD